MDQAFFGGGQTVPGEGEHELVVGEVVRFGDVISVVDLGDDYFELVEVLEVLVEVVLHPEEVVGVSETEVLLLEVLLLLFELLTHILALLLVDVVAEHLFLFVHAEVVALGVAVGHLDVVVDEEGTGA